MKQQIISLIEGKYKKCPHDSRSHCLEEECYIHEPNGFNKGIDTAIESVDEIVESIVIEIAQRKAVGEINKDWASGYNRAILDIIYKLKE